MIRIVKEEEDSGKREREVVKKKKKKPQTEMHPPSPLRLTKHVKKKKERVFHRKKKASK